MESESVSAKSVNQRIGVSGIATAFRIISRFCLNRIWLEELNQLCPRITGMTLEESLESRGQSIDSFTKPCPSSWGSSSATKPKLVCHSASLISGLLILALFWQSSRGYVYGRMDFFKTFFFVPWLLRNGYQLLHVAKYLPKGLLLFGRGDWRTSTSSSKLS